MSSIIEGLRFGWKKNFDYGQRLVADLTDDQMMLQPAGEGNPPANHPAWVFSHLNVYLPVIEHIIQGQEFADPKGHRFGMDSKPKSDPSVYASKDELVAEFVRGHEAVDRLLESATEEIFEQPVKLARWENVMPTAALALPYLMLVHENIHFGQISAWRRIQNMPSV